MPTLLSGACRCMHTSHNGAPQSASFVSHSTASKLDSFGVIDKRTQVLKDSSVAYRSLSTWKNLLIRYVEILCSIP